MKNLEQIRARNVLTAANHPERNFSGRAGGEVIKKIPPMIINHGLLATAAYAVENRGWEDAFASIAEHLSDPLIALLPAENASLDGLIRFLTREEASSDELKQVTAETMAWLNYARRLIGRN